MIASDEPIVPTPDDLAGVGRVEEVAQHVNACFLDERRGRVLLVVDVVLPQRVVDELLGLRLHPRRDERRQVERLPTVEHQAGVQQLVRLVRVHAVRRELGAVDVLPESSPAMDRAVLLVSAPIARSRGLPCVRCDLHSETDTAVMPHGQCGDITQCG